MRQLFSIELTHSSRTIAEVIKRVRCHGSSVGATICSEHPMWNARAFVDVSAFVVMRQQWNIINVCDWWWAAVLHVIKSRSDFGSGTWNTPFLMDSLSMILLWDERGNVTLSWKFSFQCHAGSQQASTSYQHLSDVITSNQLSSIVIIHTTYYSRFWHNTLIHHVTLNSWHRVRSH